MVDEAADEAASRAFGSSVGWAIALSASIATVVALASRRWKRETVEASNNPSAVGLEPEANPATEAGLVAAQSAPIISATQSAPEIDMASIRDEIKRVHELVPAIGTRWRWYEIPYRFLHWMLSGRRRRLLSWRLRSKLNKGLNFFLAFDHYARLKVRALDDPLHNLVVPTDEEVTQGGIWVVEFFPPSMYSNLHTALQRNGWDEPKQLHALDGTNAERVTRARRGSGFEWSRIGTVVDPKSRFFVPDSKREVLPEEFSLVDLTAVQLGQSLTAIVAFIRLSDKGKVALNETWKAKHEPTLTWRGLRPPHAEDRKFAAIHAVQRERKRLHDLARSWLGDRCGGFFAATESRHPVLDFNMFVNFDPTVGPPAQEMQEPLRALGMEGDHVHNFVSPQLPGGVLVPGGSLVPRENDLRNCWGLVGAYNVFADLNDRVGYGEKPYSVSTLAAMSDDALRGFLLRVAVVRYTEQLRETFSAAMDTAQTKHRDFKPQQVEQLKRELLSTSLDLPVVARDTTVLWEPARRVFEGVSVRAIPIPGRPYPPREFDVIESLAKTCNDSFQELLKDDRVYRDVLSTTSALGASAASNRLGRRALVVSGTSLLVSVTAVLTGNDAAAWHQIAEWFNNLWDLWFQSQPGK